jgi:F-type H+-transporting ATPase subunit a
MTSRRLSFIVFFVAAFLSSTFSVFAQTTDSLSTSEKKTMNLTDMVFSHVSDSHEWHIFEMNGKPVSIPLPVIIFSPESGLHTFSYSNFGEIHKNASGMMVTDSYDGFHVERTIKEKIVADDGSQVYDLSITKNILALIVSTILVIWIMLSVAKRYRKNGNMTAPRGFQNALEVVIIFLRDEVAKPNLGYKYIKYMPFLLTLFFFIWLNNLLGLLPGGANFTGNIAVTGCLALVTFIVMMAASNKHFWGHMLNPPGVPFGVKLILVVIEILSLFIKPMALMIRLFANMIAGHIVILCVICLIFIFGLLNQIVGWVFVPISLAFSVFMFMLELLVAAIQAFIFTNLAAVFIGQAIEGEDSHETGQEYHVNRNEIIA